MVPLNEIISRMFVTCTLMWSHVTGRDDDGNDRVQWTEVLGLDRWPPPLVRVWWPQQEGQQACKTTQVEELLTLTLTLKYNRTNTCTCQILLPVSH